MSMIFRRGAPVILTALLAGCVTSGQRPVYAPAQTGTIIHQEKGEIVAVRDVEIAPPNPAAIMGGPGRRIGSAVGAAAASGSITGAAMVVGSVIGGDIGAKADAKAGEEITIRLDSDEVIIVVQERGDVPLAVGEKVNVQSGSSMGPSGIARILGGAGGNVRVVRRDDFAVDTPPRPREP